MSDPARVSVVPLPTSDGHACYIVGRTRYTLISALTSPLTTHPLTCPILSAHR